MDKKDILKKVDHTLLGQTATWDDIRGILDDAMKYEAASACIPAAYVKQAAEYVAGKLPICTVIGFPNGYNTTAVKVFETKDAIANGASKNKSPKTDSFEKLNCELTDSGLKAGKIIAVTTNDITSGKLATKPPAINWVKSFAL